MNGMRYPEPTPKPRGLPQVPTGRRSWRRLGLGFGPSLTPCSRPPRCGFSTQTATVPQVPQGQTPSTTHRPDREWLERQPHAKAGGPGPVRGQTQRPPGRPRQEPLSSPPHRSHERARSPPLPRTVPAVVPGEMPPPPHRMYTCGCPLRPHTADHRSRARL